MSSLRQPDLRSLQQPLPRADLRATRRWLRTHRQATDLPSAGLAFAGWLLLVVGGLILAASFGRNEDPAMPIVSSIMVALGIGLLIYRAVVRALDLRRAARLHRFAAANGFDFAQRALLDPKHAAAFQQGFDRVALDVLRAPDGAEWGVWRFRMDVRVPHLHVGYVELPAPDDGFEPPQWMRERIARAPLPLDVTVGGGRIAFVAGNGWDQADPAVQALVHWIRILMAAATDAADTATPVDAAPADAAAPAASAAILSTPAGQRHRRRSMWFALGSVLVVIAITFVTILVRNQIA